MGCWFACLWRRARLACQALFRSPTWARGTGGGRELGLAARVQPCVEEPATRVFLTVTAGSNAPGTMEVVLQELLLLRPRDTRPFRRLAVGERLGNLEPAGRRTAEIRDMLLLYSKPRRPRRLDPQMLAARYGSPVWTRSFELALAEVAPGVAANGAFQVVVRAVFVCGGKERVVQVVTGGTCMGRFAAPPVALTEARPGEPDLAMSSCRGWLRADAHVHSYYSRDAPLASIPIQVAAAVNAGLSCLVFTDHGDHFDPESPRYAGRGSWRDQREEIRSRNWPIGVDNGEEIARDPQLWLGPGVSHGLAYDLVRWVPNYYASPYSSNQAVIDAINLDNPHAFGGPAHPGLGVYPWGAAIEETGVRVCELFDALGGLDRDAVRMWDAYHAARLSSILAGDAAFPKLAGTANSDAHNPWEVGRHSTWFWWGSAPDAVSGLYAALRNGEVVASQTPSFAYFRLNGHRMGAVIEVRDGESLQFEVAHVARGYAASHVCRVFIVRGDGSGKMCHMAYCPPRAATTSARNLPKGHRLYPAGDGYYRVAVRFRHRDSLGKMFWSWTLTQPIFFRLAAATRRRPQVG